MRSWNARGSVAKVLLVSLVCSMALVGAAGEAQGAELVHFADPNLEQAISWPLRIPPAR